ncbi:solute carrier organic anion transporter family member 2B1-like [Ptychodera flava]|uniref:solute carrier organic anion transporter family member 2B1-like n=1 Tax=Ptychodera flava TaxID=63121 RepID=UPI00396A35BC
MADTDLGALKQLGPALKTQSGCADANSGAGNFRTGCRRRLASVNFVFLMLVLNSFTLTIELSFTFISITSIQKRYGLSSRFIGLTETLQEITDITSIIFVTYFGGRPNSHKLRWIATAFLVCSLAFFTKALTQFVSTPYNYDNSQLPANFHEVNLPDACVEQNATQYLQDVDDIVLSNTTECQSTLASSLVPKGSEPVILILVAAILQGAGRNAGYALGMPYIDDNVSKIRSPMYIGTLYAVNVIGPIVGMPLSVQFIKRYVDFYRVDEITLDIDQRDPRWVGAWWMGYLLIGCLMLILALLMFLVPKRISSNRRPTHGEHGGGEETLNTAKNQMHVKGMVGRQSIARNLKENIQNTENTSNQKTVRKRDRGEMQRKYLPRVMRRLASNPTLVAIVLGNTALVANTGVAMFHPKYLEEQFRITAAQSGMFVGK